MANDSTCIFCSIIEGKAPSFKIYEDEKTIGILDIYPASKGHTLIIPKQHFDSLEETPSEIVAHLFKIGNELGKKIKEKLGAMGYNILANVGRVAGQVIFHTHIHIVPRYPNDEIRFIANQKKASNKELKEIQKKILD